MGRWLECRRRPTTGRIDWESKKHDNRNTGNYSTPLEQGTRTPTLNEDLDGDGEPNATDGDVDGDGQWNQDDDDIDGDGVPNDWDFDDDGDGIQDSDDDTPQGVEGAEPTPKKDCGCQAAGRGDSAALGLLLLMALGLILRRRRRPRR